MIPRPHRGRTKFRDNRLTGSNSGLYCAPFQLKRDFRDFPAIDGVRNRVILGSSPRTFVVAGYYLKIRIGNLCGDSRHLPLVQLMMMSSKTTSCSFRALKTRREWMRVMDLDCFREKVLLTEE